MNPTPPPGTGARDRLIEVIRGAVTGVTDDGKEKVEWFPVARLWVQVVPLEGEEKFMAAARQAAASRRARFRGLYAEVLVTDRIRFDGREWDIESTVELGRRAGLEITAVTRAEG